MPTPTYIPIANTTLGSTASSVTFSSLTQIYRDIVLVINSLPDTGDWSIRLQFNGDTGTNYPFQQMYANGSITFANKDTLNGILGNMNSGGQWGRSTYHILDYSTINKDKCVLVTGGQAAVATRTVSSRWINTAAITSIKVLTDGNSFTSGTTMALYGVAG